MAVFSISARTPAAQQLLLVLVRAMQLDEPDGLGDYSHLDDLTASDYRAAIRATRPVFKAKSLKNYER